MSDNHTTPEQTPQTPPEPSRNGRYDILTVRIVVCVLGATVLFTGLNMTVLQALGKDIPPALAQIGSVAIGALVMTLPASFRQQ